MEFADKKLQVLKAETLIHEYYRELCVTKELERHCEDVSGWKRGFLSEPDWEFLWGLYKQAEEFISEWPLRHHRDMFMEFQDTIHYLQKHGTDKVVMVDDGQDQWVIEWSGNCAKFMQFVHEIDLESLETRIIKADWFELIGLKMFAEKSEFEAFIETFGGFLTCQFLYGYNEESMSRTWDELIKRISKDELLLVYF